MMWLRESFKKPALQRHIHQFEPAVVETMGVYGESTGVILRAIGRRLVEATGEPREANWFRQNLAIAVQYSLCLQGEVSEGRGS